MVGGRGGKGKGEEWGKGRQERGKRGEGEEGKGKEEGGKRGGGERGGSNNLTMSGCRGS